MSSEQPVLWLGLAGFTPEQREHLTLLLGRLPKSWPTWRHSAFAEADAWLVSGEKCRLLSADSLKILAGLPTERAVQLNLNEVNRPLAFSLPLAAGEFEPVHTFDAVTGAGLHQVLQQFEARLRPLCSQFVLGRQLVERENDLQPGVYHVGHKGTLLAVMDLHQWRIGVSPSADPIHFELARWVRRPSQANEIPAHFLHCGVTKLRWIYAQRTERDVLPSRYRHRPVYFRRAPDVPLRWLRDSQLLLLRELSLAPHGFDALQQRTGLAPAQLARELASLYFAGSVTTTPDKAGTASGAGLADGLESGRDSESLSVPGAAMPVAAMDMTAPAQLGWK